MRYRSRKPATHAAVAVMVEVASSEPAWGYRRVHHAVRQRGIRVSRRVFLRLYEAHRLAHRRRSVPKKQRRKLETPIRRATRPNEIWATDFMSDQLVTGMRIRFLVVIDEFTRELLALRLDRTFTGAQVKDVLAELVRERGTAPVALRTDNGSEFVGEQVTAWVAQHDVTRLLSRPGKPVDNAICESTNGRIRAEFLNTTLFRSLANTAEEAASFRQKFNRHRPHSSISNLTSAVYAAQPGSRNAWHSIWARRPRLSRRAPTTRPRTTTVARSSVGSSPRGSAA